MSCTDSICGTGGWGGPKPGDPDLDNSVLTATPAFGGIDLAWSYPATNPAAVAYTILYRGVLDDFAASARHKVVAGDSYYDKIDNSLRYYYWIQIVSVNGTIGSVLGPASAVARPTIDQVIEQLTDKIDRGVLSAALKAELDQISLINTSLLNEITSRENGEITLADAMADVDAGVAQALTFIATETASRTTGDSALAEQINIVATTLGDDIAAVSVSSSASIDEVTGRIEAMYAARVQVNGLIGGFGLANDGVEVEAGFDVDTFWVGRTGPDKKKPFIISGGEVFITDAVIEKLTFEKLRAADGSVVIESGKLKAAYIKADQLDALSARIGVLRTATTGARTEIRDNVIKVYDSSNVLRVKIGDLSL